MLAFVVDVFRSLVRERTGSTVAPRFTPELRAVLENAVDETPRLAEAIDAHREDALNQLNPRWIDGMTESEWREWIDDVVRLEVRKDTIEECAKALDVQAYDDNQNGDLIGEQQMLRAARCIRAIARR